jgi:hypothetical protein
MSPWKIDGKKTQAILNQKVCFSFLFPSDFFSVFFHVFKYNLKVAYAESSTSSFNIYFAVFYVYSHCFVNLICLEKDILWFTALLKLLLKIHNFEDFFVETSQLGLNQSIAGGTFDIKNLRK